MTRQRNWRAADMADLDAIMAVEQASHFHPWSRSVMARYLGRDETVWALMLDEALSGFAVVTRIAGEAELLDIAIAPAHQGQGHGQWLLQQVIELVEASCDCLFLDVRESNAAAIAVYEKLGFCQVGVRHNYYPTAKGKEDALLYCQEFIRD